MISCDQTCRVRESEAALSASHKELLLLRKTVKQLRQQLTQVQELLATRELEHRSVIDYVMCSLKFLGQYFF